MYVNEHNIIAHSNQRTHDLRRDAAAHRLEREAQGIDETPTRRRLNFASFLRRFFAAKPKPAAEAPVKKPTLRRV